MLHIFFFVCVVWSAQIQCLKKWPVSQSDIPCDRSSHILRIVQHHSLTWVMWWLVVVVVASPCPVIDVAQLLCCCVLKLVAYTWT